MTNTLSLPYPRGENVNFYDTATVGANLITLASLTPGDKLYPQDAALLGITQGLQRWRGGVTWNQSIEDIVAQTLFQAQHECMKFCSQALVVYKGSQGMVSDLSEWYLINKDEITQELFRKALTGLNILKETYQSSGNLETSHKINCLLREYGAGFFTNRDDSCLDVAIESSNLLSTTDLSHWHGRIRCLQKLLQEPLSISGDAICVVSNVASTALASYVLGQFPLALISSFVRSYYGDVWLKTGQSMYNFLLSVSNSSLNMMGYAAGCLVDPRIGDQVASCTDAIKDYKFYDLPTSLEELFQKNLHPVNYAIEMNACANTDVTISFSNPYTLTFQVEDLQSDNIQQILGLPPTLQYNALSPSDQKVVDKHVRKLLAKYHPDKKNDDQSVTASFQIIESARQQLKSLTGAISSNQYERLNDLIKDFLREELEDNIENCSAVLEQIFSMINEGLANEDITVEEAEDWLQKVQERWQSVQERFGTYNSATLVRNQTAHIDVKAMIQLQPLNKAIMTMEYPYKENSDRLSSSLRQKIDALRNLWQDCEAIMQPLLTQLPANNQSDAYINSLVLYLDKVSGFYLSLAHCLYSNKDKRHVLETMQEYQTHVLPCFAKLLKAMASYQQNKMPVKLYSTIAPSDILQNISKNSFLLCSPWQFLKLHFFLK